MLVVSLSGDVPERTLQRLARDLRDKIEGIDSVLEAKISGNREELVEIVDRSRCGWRATASTPTMSAC